MHKNALNTLEFSMKVHSTHFNWYGVAVLSMYLTVPNTIILNCIFTLWNHRCVQIIWNGDSKKEKGKFCTSQLCFGYHKVVIIRLHTELW